MKHWRMVSVQLLVVLAACSGRDLYRSSLAHVPTPDSLGAPDVTATVKGTYCAADPESTIYPVKILVILDDSGSMKWSDPTFRRLVAARELVDGLIGTDGIFFAVEKFQNSEPRLLTQDPAFTRDRAELDGALAELANLPTGGTPYSESLDLARDTIEDDIALDPTMAERTRYIVLFLSDGVPDPPESTQSVLTTVERLKALEQGEPGAGAVTLHTAYLAAAALPGGSQSGNQDPVELLQAMAETGHGEFRNFENGESLDFTDYDVTSLARDFRTYAPILISNITARLTSDGYQADSDGDGLTDLTELEIGTDPISRDTDGDGCSDMMEHKYMQWDATVAGWEASPKHCSCDTGERKRDTDNDFLTDCEERLMAMMHDQPDSDVMNDGTPSPDSMIDYLELTWNLGRIVVDANLDYDADGVSNLAELTVHTDPNWNENQYRESYAYRYEYVNEQRDNATCYDFLVSNITLAETLGGNGREPGENQLLLYFVEAPQDNPYEERNIRILTTWVKFDPDAATGEVIEIAPTDFVSLAANRAR